MKNLWLSFCDPCAPEGEQFLGVVIIKAIGILDAIEKTWELNINPGGEVQAWVLSMDLPRDKPIHNRLLSRHELEKYGLC